MHTSTCLPITIRYSSKREGSLKIEWDLKSKTMTTTRMVVVLRTELGTQLSLAQRELKKIIDEKFKTNVYGEWTEKQRKEYYRHELKIQRLQTAIHALGALQLGDIEDSEL